jgi:hypothetical protein
VEQALALVLVILQALMVPVVQGVVMITNKADT